MPSQGTITVLVDNSAAGPGLIAEHGLAVWLDLGTRRVLFDTGQTGALGANARQLGIDIGSADTVVLSHGHYDHTGGLTDTLRAVNGEVVVHAHPNVTEPKYHRGDETVRPIGMPAHCHESLRRRGANFHAVTVPTEVAPGLFLTGEIPRRHLEEQCDEGFRRDAEGRYIDPFLDDQALFLRTSVGTMVLLGCAHAGLINTLDYIRDLTNGHSIHTVLGGMHLRSASNARIAWTVDGLRRFSIGRLYPAHCTGAKAVTALSAAFSGRCFPCGVGTMLNSECL
jgi:7,8-dihydropterin-6-yl-methyl-4-(beta-D-ribofuranosyl)aminobenzene 5'-phosphate synthase